jgi:hypothetical protein
LKPLKRGVAIPAELYAEICRLARLCDISVNRVIVRLLEIARLHLENLGFRPDCAQADNEYSEKLTLLKITRGQRILSLQRFARLAGYSRANCRDFRQRMRELERNGRLEIQQGGFWAHSLHHEKLVAIREDSIW